MVEVEWRYGGGMVEVEVEWRDGGGGVDVWCGGWT